MRQASSASSLTAAQAAHTFASPDPKEPATANPEQDAIDLVSVDESNPLSTNRLWQRSREFLSNWLGVIGVLGFFLSWELSTRLEIVNPFYFPPFSKILIKGY